MEDINAVLGHAREEKSTLGTGGMGSKLRAVQEAVHGGIECIIASGRHPEQLVDVIAGSGTCTRFIARKA